LQWGDREERKQLSTQPDRSRLLPAAITFGRWRLFCTVRHEGTFVTNAGDSRPEPFFDVIIDTPDPKYGFLGLCAGYEFGKWRHDQLAAHLIEWLPDFALTERDLGTLTPGNVVQLLRTAAKLIYDTDKYKRRGEFGELLLHAVLRRHFNTLPAIRKIYFKSALNDTVKGFDGVHVVPTASGLELWLGEVKFYADIAAAIRDVIKELGEHTKRKYLRDEFITIGTKVDPAWPHAQQLELLTSRNTSLDKVFKACVFPALLTYDSQAISAHTESCDAYREALRAEFEKHRASFGANGLPKRIRSHLILVPLKSKQRLVGALHKRLKAAQDL